MWLTFTNMCLLVGNSKTCWDREIESYDEHIRAPFQPLKDSTFHVDYDRFLAGPAKIELTLLQNDNDEFYETTVSDSTQSSAVTRSGKQIFYLEPAAEMDKIQKFKIGTTSINPNLKRPIALVLKPSALVELRFCINLETAQVSAVYDHLMYA